MAQAFGRPGENPTGHETTRLGLVENSMGKQTKGLKLPEVQLITKLSRSTIYSKMCPTSKQFDAFFPPPIRTSSRSIIWLNWEIERWLQHRIDLSRKGGTT